MDQFDKWFLVLTKINFNWKMNEHFLKKNNERKIISPYRFNSLCRFPLSHKNKMMACKESCSTLIINLSVICASSRFNSPMSFFLFANHACFLYQLIINTISKFKNILPFPTMYIHVILSNEFYNKTMII